MRYHKPFEPNLSKDKAVLFFSSSTPKHSQILFDMGIQQQLISFYYISKRSSVYAEEILPQFKEKGALLMTDSGGHTFIDAHFRGELEDECYTPEYWIPQIESYVQWLHDHKDIIYVAANMDLEVFVGNDQVDEWNYKYFKPLEEFMEITYVAHESDLDLTGVRRFEQYCKEHEYVGANCTLYKYAAKFYSLAKIYKRRIHGFAWTSMPKLKEFPFFSADSTSWLSGARYGSTYRYDGANFKAYEKGKKYLRNHDKLLCEEWGIDFDALMSDQEDAVNRYNLVAWLGVRRDYIQAANTKLLTKPVNKYAK